MSDIFKALADPTRREILLMLAQEPNSINNIASAFNMTRPAVSKHIRILQASDLVGIEMDASDGRQKNCYAQLEALKEVDTYLQLLEEHWKKKLGGLGQYLAKKHPKT